MSYTPKSYRNFKRFVGELTAYVAGTQAILLEFAEKSGSSDSMSQAAKVHGIVLSGVTPASVIQSHSRLAIVSIASGFDLYFAETEAECKAMNLSWVKPDKTSKVTVLTSNARSFSQRQFNEAAKLKTIEYYLALRNWVAHPEARNQHIAENLFKNHEREIAEVREEYGFKSAPNAISDINFHDSKLFAKLLLDVLKELSNMLRPPDRNLVESIPRDILNGYSGTNRRLKRAAKFLESEYGLRLEVALEIVNQHHDALA